MTNLLFVLFNTPLILYLLFVGIDRIDTYLPLFLLCLIPMGPSLSALFYSMHKFVHQKNTSAFKNWFKGLKVSFKASLILCLLQLMAIFIIVSNIRIFTLVYPFLLPRLLFVLLFCILLLSIPYTYLLIMRFYMPTLEVIKATFTLVFTHPILSVCNLMIFFFILMLFEVSAGTTVLFMAPIYAFFIIFSNRHLLKKIEDKASA